MAKSKQDVLDDLSEKFTKKELLTLVLPGKKEQPAKKEKCSGVDGEQILKKVLHQHGHISIPPDLYAREIQGTVDIRKGNGDVMIKLKK